MSSETEDTPQYSPIDLPFLHINSDFDCSEYSDSEDTAGTPAPTTHSTPCTPTTPLTQLASSVTSFRFSDDDTSSFSLPTPKRG